MALDTRKFGRKHTDVLRDIRPAYVRAADWMRKPQNATAMFVMGAFFLYTSHATLMWADLIFIIYCVYFLWLTAQDRSLAYKMPYGAKWKDKRNMGPGRDGKAEGIMYLGNVKDTKEEVWFTNSDARTHILYLGTTGSGKTEGLKSMVTNALTWASGFVYIDGKADTDLWSSLSSLVRRFGRDDDLLVLNYMTGNSDIKSPSNTMNPFSSGSASYLTNMLVSLMPDAEGDNAMWKERAVALVASLMPALTWKRDNQDIPMSVSTIRSFLNLNNVIKLSRDKALPPIISAGIKGYLDTLPGYIDNAFDDEGKEKPPGPDQPQYDTTTPRQQHGYLSMQFTRSLQSLGDEYGYIFDTQAADVDMIDVVLNRRVLIVLIPALEKSSDETANLGKIVAATIKGMMGSTLGSTVEGESATVIENKVTNSATPFMTVFDEVGYYTAQGMAVMAAQARSLGFCLIYSAQDLPALEKRVKEEARSITANCNLKIFGKLEDPTQTKEFFEKTVGSSMVMEASGFQLQGSRGTGSYYDNQGASLQIRANASYDGLKGLKEGEAVLAFGEMVVDAQIFYSNPGHAKAMRVTRYIALPPPDDNVLKHASAISAVRDLLVSKTWTAMTAGAASDVPDEIAAMVKTLEAAREAELNRTDAGMAAVIGVYALSNSIDAAAGEKTGEAQAPVPAAPPPPQAVNPGVPPPVVSGPPASAPPPAAEKPAESGNPMSFFSKGKSEMPPAAPPETAVAAPAEPAKKKGPINWEDLLNEATTEPSADGKTAPAAMEAAPAKPAAPARAQLDPETARILRQAGEATKRALFKGSDETEAAE